MTATDSSRQYTSLCSMQPSRTLELRGLVGCMLGDIQGAQLSLRTHAMYSSVSPHTALPAICTSELLVMSCCCPYRVPPGWEPDSEQQGSAVQEVKKKVSSYLGIQPDLKWTGSTLVDWLLGSSASCYQLHRALSRTHGCIGPTPTSHTPHPVA